PYSVSTELFQLISEHASANTSVISMHNQEASSENDMFNSGTGDLIDKLKSFGIDLNSFDLSAKNSLESVVHKINSHCKLLLVHNTYSEKIDIESASQRESPVAWCFCPNANIYIENNLPDFDMFSDTEQILLLGTDSLASNDQLNILSEMLLVQENSKVKLEELIKWACSNAAQFFSWNDLGAFEKDMSPGLNWIENVDTVNFKIKKESKVHRLL
ncbi:MAG: amidohydrolase family protein, partial [Bacteroidia bacterium]|nr:amidohydrolase family protein [Bacteroidia bacterium]